MRQRHHGVERQCSKKAFHSQNNHYASQISKYNAKTLLRTKRCSQIDTHNIEFDFLEGAFLSSFFQAQGACFSFVSRSTVDDASIDGKRQNISVAQTAKDDSVTVLLKNNVFELPMDCKDDVGMYSTPATPHDKDVMHKVTVLCNDHL